MFYDIICAESKGKVKRKVKVKVKVKEKRFLKKDWQKLFIKRKNHVR